MPRDECTLSRDGGSVTCICSDGSTATGSCSTSGGETYCPNPCN